MTSCQPPTVHVCNGNFGWVKGPGGVLLKTPPSAAPAVAPSAHDGDVVEGERRPPQVVPGEWVVRAAGGVAVGAPRVELDGGAG